MEAKDIKKQLAALDDERNAVALYKMLAEAEKDPQLAEIFQRFVAAEQKHVAAWEKTLAGEGVTPQPFGPSWRTRVLGMIARRLGVRWVLPTVKAMESSAVGDYSAMAEAKDMVGDEASHARLLQQISGGMDGGQVAQLEGRHSAGGGNALRAAVLGANDGLVSNLSLVMGVAGAALSGQQILVTGLAGLLAGACSMALGEWLSVQSSRELYQRQIEIETQEIIAAPQEETHELALIYQSRGLSQEQAQTMAAQIMSNRDSAVEALVREELSVDMKELGGSAWVAAATSFALFAIGAILPVIPFIFLAGKTAIAASAVVSTCGLFTIGAAITLFTGKPAWWSGARMVIFGLTAAAITFAIGRIIGVSIAG